jgi:hypothetical protein
MSELTKAQKLRARKEMVRQKQQAAIEKKDIARNAKRAENIRRRKNAAEKMGKKYSHIDATTPSVEVGPINYGSPMKKSSCIKMYDKKGKQSGLMMEGSVAHMESAMEMSPYKMEDKKVDEFGTPIPEGFKADAAGVTGTMRKITSEPIKFGDHGYGIKAPTVRDIEGKRIPGAGRALRDEQDPRTSHPRYEGMIPSHELRKKFPKGKVLTTSVDKK